MSIYKYYMWINYISHIQIKFYYYYYDMQKENMYNVIFRIKWKFKIQNM